MTGKRLKGLAVFLAVLLAIELAAFAAIVSLAQPAQIAEEKPEAPTIYDTPGARHGR